MIAKRLRRMLAFLALLVVAGCATAPTGPTVLVLPAPGKPFEVFQADVTACRNWASLQAGNPQDYDEAQRRYDQAYLQCMYAKGNQVPGVVHRTRRTQGSVPPPPPDYESVPQSPPPAPRN